MVEGTQVGAYRVLHRIGSGGMGVVYLAEHAMLGRRAALKMLHPSYSMQPEIVSRFFNEARAATAISDPGIVQVFDFGHHVDGSAYIVMELLEGEALEKRLTRAGHLAPQDAMRICRQIASSVGAAHARGIVHRDLKPENVYLVRDPEVAGGERVKILDFGIAKLAGDSGVKTQTSAVIGTPIYMSPEQCRGAGQIDTRSDVYSIGCILFVLLTGEPPFMGAGPGDVIAMHLREPPPAPSSRMHGISRELDELVLRCLAKDPARRFANATELAAAIGAFSTNPAAPVLHAQTVNARGPRMMASPTTLSGASGVTHAQSRSRRRWPLIAGIATVAAAGGAIAIVIATHHDTLTPPPAPAPPVAQAAVQPPPPPPPAPDPNAALAARMKDVLGRFGAWANTHAGAACPDIAALGGDVSDPWGHAMKLSCSDQPSDQIVGLVSAGPDGAFGTADDVGSWELGREVTAEVHGARWKPAPPPPAPPVAVSAPPPIKKPPPHAPPKPPATPPTGKHPTQPIQLDENGIPVSR
jgi:serine/threonine-protein kinase